MGWFDRIFRRQILPNPSDLTYPGASAAAVMWSTYGSPNNENILPTFVSQTQQAYQSNAVVFAVILSRLMLFSEATFQVQSLADKKLFGKTYLKKLEQPWPNGTSGELLARMEQDTSLAGNFYCWDAGSQLVRLRPDMVTIVSEEVVDAIGRPYRVVRGYFFDPASAGDYDTPSAMFTVDEVAHWSPIPDPLARFRGMSWLTPVIREIVSDSTLTDYKIQFLANAATPNIMIKYSQKVGTDTIERLTARIDARHGGVENAFRTLILDEGADFTVVGNTFEQMNFTTVQAAGENRIAAAGGVPGIVVGLKEGLMAATYSNYEQAMRRFADLTMRPLWRSACGCLQKLLPEIPDGARLWYDTSDIAALRQGEKEAAETMKTLAEAAMAFQSAGYDLNSIVTALDAGEINLLTVPELKPIPAQLMPFANGSTPPNGAIGNGNTASQVVSANG